MIVCDWNLSWLGGGLGGGVGRRWGPSIAIHFVWLTCFFLTSAVSCRSFVFRFHIGFVWIHIWTKASSECKLGEKFSRRPWWCRNIFTPFPERLSKLALPASVHGDGWNLVGDENHHVFSSLMMSDRFSLSLPDWHGVNLRPHCDAEWVRATPSIHPLHQLIHSLLARRCCHTWRLMLCLHFVTLWLRKSIWTSNIGFPAFAGWEIAEGRWVSACVLGSFSRCVCACVCSCVLLSWLNGAGEINGPTACFIFPSSLKQDARTKALHISLWPSSFKGKTLFPSSQTTCPPVIQGASQP